jgi:ureidoglycolate lyase
VTNLRGAPSGQEAGATAAQSGIVLAQPLEAAAFAPFGEVVAHDGQPGRTMMDLAFDAESGTTPRLWVNRLAPSACPIVADTFERHPFSAQTFLPLRGGRWIVIVALGDPGVRPRSDGIQAFMTSSHQGIIYRPGIWHHGLISLDADAEVAVLMGFTGREDDTVLADLALPVMVDLSSNKD